MPPLHRLASPRLASSNLINSHTVHCHSLPSNNNPTAWETSVISPFRRLGPVPSYFLVPGLCGESFQKVSSFDYSPSSPPTRQPLKNTHSRTTRTSPPPCRNERPRWPPTAMPRRASLPPVRLLLPSCTSVSFPEDNHALTMYLFPSAYDKQKVLLSSEVGHFSLIRAMHLADLITEMNGTSSLPHSPSPLLSLSSWELCTNCWHARATKNRLLRHHVRLLLHALPPRRPFLPRQPLRCPGLPTLWPVLRLHGRQGRALAQEEQHDGPGT